MEVKDFEEFDKKKGLILGQALSVETTLEFFITNYIVKPQTGKTHFLNDILVDKLRLSFEDKIKIFSEICKREEYDAKKVKSIIKSIRYVQESRNKVAHWQGESNEYHIQLRRRKTRTEVNKDVFRLTEETMKKIDSERLAAQNGVIEFYLKYQREGTIDENPDHFEIIG